MKRMINALSKLILANTAYAVFVVFVLLAMTAMALPAQTFTTLFSFEGKSPASPYGSLVQATNGDLYGTTFGGGAYGGGMVFKITQRGTLTTLYSFCTGTNCPKGTGPQGGLFEAASGELYGTTTENGAYGYGTVFRITLDGALTSLYSFCPQSGCADGNYPLAGLVQARGGDLYGTTYLGGSYNDGTVFKITPGGSLTTLYSFCSESGCPDGAGPQAGLIQAFNGRFYGTAYAGGNKGSCTGVGGCGTVFEITSGGELTTLHTFCSKSGCPDGLNPQAGLIQTADGDLYGTASAGGAYNEGTVFKITPSGTFTTLYSFCSQSGCPDGRFPEAGLIQATDGNLYGTTASGGKHNHGTVFQLTPAGDLTTLHSFCSESGCPDGWFPEAGLIQATDGNLYGTTASGGASTACSYRKGCGTVFRLSVGLGPFAGLRPRFGEVGDAVQILGRGLTGTTSVTFNGTAASFNVVSDTEITTTVPAGATTGKVEVVTPGGTLSSGGNFRVR